MAEQDNSSFARAVDAKLNPTGSGNRKPSALSEEDRQKFLAMRNLATNDSESVPLPAGGRDVTAFEQEANKSASPINAPEITDRMPAGGRDVTAFEQVANLSEDMTRNDTSFGLKNIDDQARNAAMIDAALQKDYPTPLPAGGRDVTAFEQEANKPVEGKPAKSNFLAEAGYGPAVKAQQETPAVEPAKLEQLFKTAHGSGFDPNSKSDRAKMATIQSMLAKQPELANISPNKFALKLYSRK